MSNILPVRLQKHPAQLVTRFAKITKFHDGAAALMFHTICGGSFFFFVT